MERENILYKIRRKGQVFAHRIVPTTLLVKLYSAIVLKKKVNIRNPETFNEKILWSMLYYYPNDPLVIKCTDKYSVREYIKDKKLGKILVPLYGVWDSVDEIKWDEMPDKFVLKCTHGCAYNIICHNKSFMNIHKIEKQLSKWLSEDFGEFNNELHYSKIKSRRIICEKYLGECITDYKFFCFSGQPKYLYVSNDLAHDRQAQIGFFDLEGNRLQLRRKDYKEIQEVEFPPFYNEMIECAKILSKDFPFVRVDFFLADNKFYFAELTFTPSGGMMPFDPIKDDLEWGREINLSEKYYLYNKKSKI